MLVSGKVTVSHKSHGDDVLKAQGRAPAFFVISNITPVRYGVQNKHFWCMARQIINPFIWIIPEL